MSKLLRAVTTLLASAALLFASTVAVAQPIVQQPAGERPPVYYVLPSASLTATGVLFQGEAGGYPAINFQFTSVGTSNQITVTVSNDNANWQNSTCSRRDTNLGPVIVGAFSPSSSVWYSCETTMRFARVSVTTYGSGTVTMRGIFNTNPAGTWTRVIGDGSGAAVESDIIATGGNALVNDAATAGTQAPVPVGGKHETSPPTFTNGQAVTNRYTNRGEQLVAISSGGSLATMSGTPVNGVSNTANLLQVMAKGYVVNPAGTWDQQRGSVSTFNGVGDGITAASLHGVCDDTANTTTSENNFGPMRKNCNSGELLVAPSKAALTDRSSTIATGGTSQQAMAGRASRRYVMCQNIDTAIVEDMWVNFGAAAAVNTAGSIRLASGASITFEGTFVPTDAVNVIAATTGHRYTCKED